jgi:hypothetical protein
MYNIRNENKQVIGHINNDLNIQKQDSLTFQKFFK